MTQEGYKNIFTLCCVYVYGGDEEPMKVQEETVLIMYIVVLSLESQRGIFLA